jgi:hypothetical protein
MKHLLLTITLFAFTLCAFAQKAPVNSRAFRPGPSGTVKGTNVSGNVDDVTPAVQAYIPAKLYVLNDYVLRDGRNF